MAVRPPISLKAAATRRAKDRRAHAAAASQHEHAKSVQPEQETAQKPGQPLFFSPSLCIYFQVSAILSAPAERPGRRRRRRNTVSRKTRAKGEKRKQPQEDKVYPPLTLAMAFLYLMTACWMSECTFIFPSPHGTTTRVRPKHTVTFMVLVSDESPGFGLRRRGRDQEEEEEAVRKQAEGAWSSLLVRLCPGIPARGSSGVSAARRRTTLLSLCL